MNSQKSSNELSADNMGMKTMLQNILMEKGVVGVLQSPALVVWSFTVPCFGGVEKSVYCHLLEMIILKAVTYYG